MCKEVIWKDRLYTDNESKTYRFQSEMVSAGQDGKAVGFSIMVMNNRICNTKEQARDGQAMVSGLNMTLQRTMPCL
jgi:hypothetical protein